MNCCRGSKWAPPVAWGDAGTAGPCSSHLSHARCCLLCRDDPGPVQQCVPIPASPEQLLHEGMRVTQGHTMKKRDLFLFRDALVIAEPK